MKIDLFDLIHDLEYKDIALLGNASSIMKTKKDIDKHEIVCRINRGTPQGKESYIGSRTDVLFTATKIDPLLKQFNAKYIIWTTKCTKLLTPKLDEIAYQNPPEDWEKLKALCPVDKLPSTGLVALQFLAKQIHFKNLTIYGFDCFHTGTWYHSMKNQPWHVGEFEESFINKLIKEQGNIQWIK